MKNRDYIPALAIAVGILLWLLLPDNWMMQIVACALVSAGALRLQTISRWFLRASIVADVLIFFQIVAISPLLAPSVLKIMLYGMALAVQCLTGCLLICGCGQTMHRAGKNKLPEWLLLILWAVGWIAQLLCAVCFSEIAADVTRVCAGFVWLSSLVLIVDVCRVQRQIIRMEGKQYENSGSWRWRA